jgi:TPP-dependent pyruvate/acetoin dehydrogenase alpha subunit
VLKFGWCWNGFPPIVFETGGVTLTYFGGAAASSSRLYGYVAPAKYLFIENNGYAMGTSVEKNYKSAMFKTKFRI